MSHLLRASRRPVIRLLTVPLAAAVAFGAAGLSSSPAAATSPLPPMVLGVSPNHGPAAGGNEVLVSGSSLAGGVTFDGVEAEVVRGDGQGLVVTAPEGLAGATVEVLPVGRDRAPIDITTENDYTYDGPKRYRLSVSPATGASRGGTLVTITAPAGADLSDADEVLFGSFEAKILSRTPTALTVQAPGGIPLSSVAVTVTGADGHSDGLRTPIFNYGAVTDPPQITKITPNWGYSHDVANIVVEGIGLEDIHWGPGVIRIDGEAQFSERVVLEPGGPVALKMRLLPHAVGKVDVRAEAPLGVSPDTSADDFTYVANLPAPEIESISRSSVPRGGDTVVTVRGKNLTGTDRAEFSPDGWAPTGGSFEVVSDTEVRITAPTFKQTGTAVLVLRTAGGGFADPQIAPTTIEVVEPAALTLNRSSGPLAGGNAVTFTGAEVTMRLVDAVEFDGISVPVSARTATSVTAIAPPHAAGTGAIVLRSVKQFPDGLESVDGWQLNGPTDSYSWADSALGDSAYTVNGTATLKTLVRGTFAFGPSSAALNFAADGTVRGLVTLGDANARLISAGFLPLTARLGFVASGPATGTLGASGLTLAGKYRVKVKKLRLFGAIPLALGNACQTRQLAAIDLAGAAFNPQSGGRLTSTFAMSDLNGCGALTGLLSPLTAGGGNTITLDLTPKG